MNILNECAINDFIIIIMGLLFYLCNTLQTIYIKIIGGKYIFRVKTNKTQKKLGWDFLTGVFVFWVLFLMPALINVHPFLFFCIFFGFRTKF